MDGQGQQLSDLDPDVESNEVWQEAILGHVIFEHLGSKAQPVEQPEDQRSRLGIGLEAKPALEGADIVQRLVNHRKPDDGVDEIGADSPVEIDAQQHRG